MKLSVNELEVLAWKAAFGAGIDHGHAQQMAKNTTWLFANNINGAEPLKIAIKNFSSNQTKRLDNLSVENETLTFISKEQVPVSIFFIAPALGDLLQIKPIDGQFNLCIHNVECASLLLAQLARMCLDANIDVISSNNSSTDINWQANLNCGTVSITTDLMELTTAPQPLITISTGAKDIECAPLQTNFEELYSKGISITDDDYNDLYHFYKKTLVPDSEHSRIAGAGAGVVDND